MPLDAALSERLPTPDEIRKARLATQTLAKFADKRGALSLRLRQKEDGEVAIELPAAISRMVMELLMLIGKGEAVTLVPIGAELTTQQAADLLNVSRPFLIKLLKEKRIPYHTVGTHRRIRAEDIFSYKQKRDAKRAKALEELARLGQEIDAE
jgi:excisionase family DNA binding protein